MRLTKKHLGERVQIGHGFATSGHWIVPLNWFQHGNCPTSRAPADGNLEVWRALFKTVEFTEAAPSKESMERIANYNGTHEYKRTDLLTDAGPFLCRVYADDNGATVAIQETYAQLLGDPASLFQAANDPEGPLRVHLWGPAHEGNRTAAVMLVRGHDLDEFAELMALRVAKAAAEKVA